MRKIWELPGGVHPPENKAQSMGSPIVDCPLASEYILPLNQHIGAPALPLVNIGENVKKYQCIADAAGVFSAAVHAPTSGTVIAIEERFIAHPSGLKAPCIVISADGLDEAAPLSATEDPFALSHSELIEKIRSAGIVGLGGAGFPSAIKLNPKANSSINTLILNGTECEPYITADDALMQTYAEDVINGAKLLAHTLGNPESVLIGVEDNKPDAIAALTAAAKGSNIEIVSFPTKYPSGGEKQLIYILTGKEVPSGSIPASLGIVVQNVGTAVAVWQAVKEGKPLIERITTVVGQSLKQERNLRVRLGTPINHVLAFNDFQQANSARLIIGGPMMGFAIEQTEVPVVKTTNCILAPSMNEMPEAPPQQACIRCSHCAEACPAGLLPQQLYWYATADDQEKLNAHNLFDCIECGACSYVCPSAIPLVQYYRSAKGSIRKTQEEKQKSDRARERFEQRQQRLAKAEAAKEAKRLARKAAAEKNKAKAAAAPTPKPAVTEAPELDIARIERTLESLTSRLARQQEQIKEAEGDSARQEKLTAQLKQTELKISDTQKKLAAAKSTESSNDAIDKTVEAFKEKVQATPADAALKNLESLKKRLATAKEKLTEAEAEQKPTVDALRQGVEKLEAKVAEAELALNDVKAIPAEEAPPVDAAAAAIERAKAKAKAAASMSPEEKRAANIASLEKRLAKAKARLEKAQQENDENVEAFAAGVTKLEQKLAELTEEAN